MDRSKETPKPSTAPRPRQSDSPIASARIALGLTQKQLADAVGCKQKDISRYETGARNPGVNTLEKLARVFDCPIEKLIK